MTPVECGPSIFVVAGVQPDDYIVRTNGRSFGRRALLITAPPELAMVHV
jgi:hypothetical protein